MDLSPSPSCFLFDKYNSTGGLKSAWHDRKTLEATKVRENKSYFLAAKAATSREEAEQRIIRRGHVARWHVTRGATGPVVPTLIYVLSHYTKKVQVGEKK